MRGIAFDISNNTGCKALEQQATVSAKTIKWSAVESKKSQKNDQNSLCNQEDYYLQTSQRFSWQLKEYAQGSRL